MASQAFSLAIGVGFQALSMLLKPKKKDEWTLGSRLSDLNVPTVSPGNEIPRVWGHIKVPSQAIWTSRLIETPHIAQQREPGGKGGKGGSTHYTVSYTYSVNLAQGICRGPISQVNRIWAQGKLLWTNPIISQADIQASFDAAYISEGTRLLDLGVTYEEASVSGYIFAYNNFYDPATMTPWTVYAASAYISTNHLIPGVVADPIRVSTLLGQLFDPVSFDKKFVPTKIRYDSLTIYNGNEFQEPDPTMQAALGASAVPAYRGLAYFVINNLQLADFGNTVPSFTVEVVKDGVIVFDEIVTKNYSNISAYVGGEVPPGFTLTPDGTSYVQQKTSKVARVVPEVITLGRIIDDILTEAGMPTDSFLASTNLSATMTVPGFAITNNTSARQVIQDLQRVFAFDGCESGWKVKFQPLNKRACAILRRKDFAARQSTDDMIPSWETERTSELEMPRRINLKYQEPARNYSMNTVFAEREVGQSLAVEDIDLSMALDRDVAKQLIEQVMVQRFWQRNHYTIMLPRKYIVLEPGDVVMVEHHDYPGEFMSLRVVRAALGANGLLHFTFCDADYLSGDLTAITGEDIDVDDPTLPSNSRTYAYMLDIPLLSDLIPDEPQFFVVLSGVTPGWKSGGLLVDLADAGEIAAYGETGKAPVAGSNWFNLVTNTIRVPHGFATTTLDPTVKAGSWDYKSEVIVHLMDKTWVLTNADPYDMLSQPLNTCCIGGEICAYANAEDLGNGTWRLTRWLRGLRGTDYLISKHEGVEKFVRLNGDAIQRVPQTQAAMNKSATFVALSSGEVVGDEEPFEFTNTGNSLRPYAPAVTEADVNPSGDLSLKWQPRNRINGGWASGSDITLDQAVEAYEIDVVTVDGDGNDVVHKTYSFGAVRNWSYSAASMLTDTGVSSGISINLYQIGAIVGRGFPSRIGVN